MTPLAQFWWHQRRAFRALVRRRRPVLFVEAPATQPHPSSLCKCFGPEPGMDHAALAHSDHDPGCLWLAAMCKTCLGCGWCSACGGEGVEPAAGVE